MSEGWRRRILLLAGAWNLVAGVSALSDPTRHFAQLYTGALALEDPLQAFFFRATWINVIAWGIAYILAGWFAAARKPVLLAGAAGKLAYFVAALALFLKGGCTTTLLGFSALDVVFAVLFLYILGSPKRQSGEVR